MYPTDVSAAIKRLTHPVAHQRRMAALALGRVYDREVSQILIERLTEEEDMRVREDITWGIVQRIEMTLPQVLDMIASDSADKRKTGAHVLSKVSDPDHLQYVAHLVNDPDDDVAIKAYRAVAHTRRPEAGEILAQALGRGDQLQWDCLSSAYTYLGELGVPALVSSAASEDIRIREHVAEAIGYVGHKADGAVEALATLASDESAKVRLAAVSALGQLSPDVADAVLEQLTESDDETVAAIAREFLDRRFDGKAAS